jgi:hypothetical protein
VVCADRLLTIGMELPWSPAASSSSLEQIGVCSRSGEVDSFVVNSINQHPVGFDVAISKIFHFARKGVISVSGIQSTAMANRFDHCIEPIKVFAAFRESLQVAFVSRARSNRSFRLASVSRHASKP